MRLIDFAVPLAGSLCLMGSSSLFSPLAAHPHHRAESARSALLAAAPPFEHAPEAELVTAEQSQRRCNTGRLIGGLAGGGLGYAASRGDGRAWAIPLGALLGSQVGCPMAQGRGPLDGLGF